MVGEVATLSRSASGRGRPRFPEPAQPVGDSPPAPIFRRVEVRWSPSRARRGDASNASLVAVGSGSQSTGRRGASGGIAVVSRQPTSSSGSRTRRDRRLSGSRHRRRAARTRCARSARRAARGRSAPRAASALWVNAAQLRRFPWQNKSSISASSSGSVCGRSGGMRASRRPHPGVTAR